MSNGLRMASTVTLLLTLTGCANSRGLPSQPTPLRDEWRAFAERQAKAEVSRHLIYPSTAVFGVVRKCSAAFDGTDTVLEIMGDVDAAGIGGRRDAVYLVTWKQPGRAAGNNWTLDTVIYGGDIIYAK